MKVPKVVEDGNLMDLIVTKQDWLKPFSRAAHGG
jgi:hypothetical protein